MKIVNDVCEYSDGVICTFENCRYYDASRKGSKKWFDGRIKHEYSQMLKNLGMLEGAYDLEDQFDLKDVDCPLLRYLKIEELKNEG
ncbi:MAG: hypothetical protein ACTSPI_15620 [Candidatus Heimdallarchaeaceae archaeon]